MKKYISYLLTLALLVPAFVSCTQERDFLSRKQKTHTVHFATSDPATRTGLTIEDNMVKPDWRKTDLENIHFFEIDATNAAAPGTADEISLSDDNRTAHFKAAISDEIIINVPTSSDATASGTSGAKGTGVSPYTFAAVVAQMPDKDAFTFVIPSEQHPDAETLKDPNAEFLVGYSRKSYDAQYDYDSDFVDLYFDRVAALGRLAISGFVGTGEKVKSVTITATGGMTGKATYPGDFTLGDKNKVNFTKVDEPLVLNYGDGVAVPVEDPFYAYFVAAPGEATVTSIEVLTDQYKYTKTVAQGAKFTFSDVQLLNINFALSKDIAEAVTADNKTWYKASVLEDGQSYLIVSEGQALKNTQGETDVLAIQPQDGVITFESSIDPTIVWTAKAHVEYYDVDDTKPAGHYVLSQGEGDASLYFERYSDKQTQNGSIVSAPTADSNGNYKYYVWEYDGEHLYQISRDGNDGVYCLTYNSGWKFEYQSKPNTYLYTNRPPVEISFASAEAKYDLENGEWTVAIPELTAPEGAVVTYSSSNEDIATVAADGTVTPKAAGNVRITATVAGDDMHQGGSAYYELVVTTSKITTWYKAEKIVAGETYLVISHNYALNNNGTSGGEAVLLEGVGETIQYNAPETMIWTATNESSGKFRLTGSDGKVIRLSSNSFQIGTASGTESNNQWSLDANGLVKSGNYFLYYSTSQSKWLVSSTASESHTGYLYTSTQPLASRNLSFSPETVTHDLADGDDVNEPELTGDSIEGVTYASENEQIATVNETGNIILTGKTGSVKITASFQKTDTYKAETVSYTLKVVNSNAPTKTYRKVTSASELVVGSQYLLVYEESSKVFKPILDGTTFKKTSDNAQSVTISGNMITSNELEDDELTLEDGYYLYVSSVDRYVYPEGGSSGTSLPAESTASHKLTITINSNGTAKISSSDVANFTWSSSGYFSSTYQATTTFVVCLYKLDDGSTPPTPEKQERNLSFGTESFSCTLGQSATFPTLSGVTEGVTYSSSDESVATVNASGVVTVIAAGTTIIKAEAQESDTYLAGSAQYTLTVNPASTPTIVYYQKVTSSSEFVQDGVYIIVSESNNKLFKPILNSSKANFETTGNTIDVTITDGKIASSSTVDACQIVLKNPDGNGKFALWIPSVEYYLQVYNGSNFKAATDDDGYRSTFSVDASGVASIYRDNSHYIRYSATNSAFQVGNNASNIAVYKLVGEGGSTPGDGDDPIPTTSKRYTYTSSISAGTYLIGGSESSTYYIAVFPVINKTWTSSGRSYSGEVLNHMAVDANTITTSDEDVINSEVELIASGSGWKIKTKEGQYFAAPTADYSIPFTDDINSAAVYTISSSSTTTGSYNFYHSGSAAGFTQRTTTGNTLRFYKLSE